MNRNYTHTMVWFEGVVEDRGDPLMLGRVRVRVFGLHTQDKGKIPTEDLPWAQVINPVTSASASGVGQSSGLVNGSHVVGFFRDGHSAQDPVVWGSYMGIPQGPANPESGFSDPDGEYPRSKSIGEPDTPRLSRREQLSSTLIKERNERSKTEIKSASGTSWKLPGSAFNGQYPYNKVHQSESGHVIELDDTPGSERLHWSHRIGTYTEIDANGTRVDYIVGDGYRIIARNEHVYVQGSVDTTIDGDRNLFVKNAMNVRVLGDCVATFENDVDMNVHGTLRYKVQEDLVYDVQGDYILNVDGRVIQRSSGGHTVSTDGEASFYAGATMALDAQGLFLNCGRARPTSPEVEGPGERAETTPSHFPPLPPSSISEDIYNDYDEPENAPPASHFQKMRDLGLPEPTGEPDVHPDDAETDDKEAPATESEPVSCAAFQNGKISETAQISPHYKLRDVSSNAVVSKYRVRPQVGLTSAQIACNLKAITNNCAEKIRANFPDMMITSGFRHGSGSSQHYRGEAIDLQFRNAAKSDYYDIAKWIRDNVPFDQLILEFKNTGTGLPWIHISFKQSSLRAQYFTMFNHRVVSGYGEFKQLA